MITFRMKVFMLLVNSSLSLLDIAFITDYISLSRVALRRSTDIIEIDAARPKIKIRALSAMYHLVK